MRKFSCYSCGISIVNPANLRLDDETESFCWECWRNYLIQLEANSSYWALTKKNDYDIVLDLVITQKLESLRRFYLLRKSIVKKMENK